MSQRLFQVAKIGTFIDSYAPGVEKRRGDEISVVTVKCRVQPFDAKLATALDDGVGGDSNIKSTVFNLSTAEPKPNFTRHDFKLASLPRQNLEIFAAPDTDASRIALTQAKISGCYVRTQKDMNALALCFKATWGPVGRDELELIHSLHRSQTFITFHEAEPLLETEADDGPDDEGPVSEEVIDGRVVRRPMWEDDEQSAPAETASDAQPPEPARHASPRHADRTAAAKAKQRAGKKR